MRNINMEDAQGYYNHEDEIISLSISLGNAMSKSNEHKIKVESMEMVETMRIL
jgi:hypothetical protein